MYFNRPENILRLLQEVSRSMCMGVTHRTINTMVSFPIAGALLVQAHWHPLQAIIFLGGYTFATFLMNPDLDLDSLGYQSWGVLRFIWWPYQKALAHRCFLSHFPVVGTVCRIIYLMWVPILILLILGGRCKTGCVPICSTPGLSSAHSCYYGFWV